MKALYSILFSLILVLPAHAISDMFDPRWRAVTEDFVKTCEVLEKEDKSMGSSCFCGMYDVFYNLPDKEALLVKEKGTQYFMKRYKKEFRNKLNKCIEEDKEIIQEMENDIEYYEALERKEKGDK